MNPLCAVSRLRVIGEGEFARAVRGRLVYVSIFLVAVVVVLSALVGAKSGKPLERNGYFLFCAVFSRGVFVAALCTLVFGALSISYEGSQGLFRMILIRPFRRWEYFAGKVVVTATFGLFLLWVAFALSYLSGGLAFGYGDVTDPEYTGYLFTAKEAMMSALWKAGLAQIPIMLAVAGLSLLASVMTDNPGIAVGSALGAYFAGSIVSILSEKIGALVFTTYSGFLLRGTLDDAGNPIAVLSRMAETFTNFKMTGHIINHAWEVGIASFVIFIFIAGLRFTMRDILR